LDRKKWYDDVDGRGSEMRATGSGRAAGRPRRFVLRDPQGRDASIRRDEIEEMAASRASIMPEGLLSDLSDREARDLFAYLRGNQPPK